MTGTAQTEAAELMSIYKLGVVPIPTNRPMVRAGPVRPDLQDRGGEVRRRRRGHRRAARAGPAGPGRHGQRREERVPRRSCCAQREIPHEVLNAKQHEREAAIVAQAGRKGAVTVATNMAGRGTDIMLGGNAEFMAVARAARAAGWTRPETPEEYEAAWPDALKAMQEAVAAEHDEVVELRRAVRAGHRAARVAPDRQPAARPVRPAGRPGREPVLPLAGRRPDAPVQLRHGRVVPDRGEGPGRRPDRVARWSPGRSPARRARSRGATSRSARTCSSTTTC